MNISDELAATAKFTKYSTQVIPGIKPLLYQYMPQMAVLQSVRKASIKENKVCISLYSLSSGRKMLTGGAGGLWGSVSMATSQLGNHWKSKHEGDIKGMNDEKMNGRWRQRDNRQRADDKKGEDGREDRKVK